MPMGQLGYWARLTFCNDGILSGAWAFAQRFGIAIRCGKSETTTGEANLACADPIVLWGLSFLGQGISSIDQINILSVASDCKGHLVS